MKLSNILFISLEFVDPVFSGNGVYARSQVSAYLKKGVDVTVVCGKPSQHSEENRIPYAHVDVTMPGQIERNHKIPESIQNIECPYTSDLGVITVHAVHLPVWFTTDRYSSWEYFSHRGASLLLEEFEKENPLFHFDLVVGVDWTSTMMYNSLEKLTVRSPAHKTPAPYLALVARAYVLMTEISAHDTEFYRSKENLMARTAKKSGGGMIFICEKDQETFLNGDPPSLPEKYKLLPPALRSDMWSLAKNLGPPSSKSFAPTFTVENNAKQKKRKYFVSLVRIVPEKGVMRFLEVVERLKSYFEESNIIPVLGGGYSDQEFADEVKKRLRNAIPSSVIYDRFLSPKEMSEILSLSLLNFHGALYEAYGMTIVEAASFGCPSMTHHDSIGALYLLRPEDNMCFTTDMNDITLVAQKVKDVLNSRDMIATVAKMAYEKAIEWDEELQGNALFEFSELLLNDDSVN